MSMIRATIVLTTALGALLGVPATAAEWDHRVNSVHKNITGKVPTTLTQATAVPANTGDPANICAGFGHMFNQTEQGYLKVKFSTFRTDPKTGDTTTQVMRKRGAVVNSQWVRCVVVKKLLKDDIVVAEWEILEMPRGRGGDLQATLHIGENRLPLSDLISRKSGSTLTMSAHRVNSVQKNIKGKVPAALTQATAVPADTGNRVDLCAGFGHTFKQTEKGRLRVRFSTFRTDPETGETKRQRTRITGRIEDSRWVGCLKVEKLLKNDIVVAEWEILDMPRGRGGEIQVVTHLGEDRLRSKELIRRPPPPAIEPPTGGGGGGGADTSQVSAEDQAAISAMSKMTAISVGTRLRGTRRTFLIAHRYNCSTLLEAPTIAGAYNKFVQACGRRATGGSLTKSQNAAIVKLKGMKHITGIRWESDGRVFGEYWSQSTGTRAKSTNSIAAAVNWLVKEGRTVGDEATGGGGGGGGGGGDPDPDPPPTDTGQVSAAEQKVFSALSKMTAIGIGTRDNGTVSWLIAHRYNCKNYLQTSTITGVYNLFVKACGNRGVTGGALTGSEIAAVAKFKRAFGITGLRWESGGRVIGEYYTAATGTVHQTFKSIEAAVKWLDGQGRFR